MVIEIRLATPKNGIYFCLCLSDRRTRKQPPDRLPALVEIARVAWVNACRERRVIPVAIRCQRSPELLISRGKLKSGRHHANDLRVQTVDLKHFANRIARTAKTCSPQPITQNDYPLPLHFFVRRK